MKVGVLVSGGKDSIFASYLASKKNEIVCFITLKSKNKDSYMFHVPNINLVKLQAETIGVNLVERETKGVKEEELIDLKKAIETAKKKYKIKGLVSGALASNYQKTRIENICKELKLKSITPLWHMDQEKELRKIINSSFKFIITKVSSYGLNKRWLNRVIIEKDVDELIKLSSKVGFNIAFEGGEAETLMIDGPIFNKKIEIVDSSIEEESENVAELVIKKAKLVKK